MELVTDFYELMLQDELLAPIFLEVAKIDLEQHLPHLVDFWYSILFMTGEYRRNVMEMHLSLGRRVELKPEHFDRWLGYFKRSVQKSFAGPKADLAIERAQSIALLMQVKLSRL